MDTVRGGDATGVFVVAHDHGKDKPWADWRKQASGGHEFVLTHEYKELFEPAKTMDYKFCVGHNRSATIGGANVDAAHPFQEGPITLVHNGTVNQGEVQEKRAAGKFFNDSHTICHMLSKEDATTVVSKLDGAFALIWHDARDDSLNFVRNAARPLHFAKSKGTDTIYFASEAEMLYWLDRRLTLKLQDIVSMKPAHLLKFQAPKLMIPTVTEVKLHVPKASAPRQAGYTAQQWSGTTGSGTGNRKEKQTTTWIGKIKNKGPKTYVTNHPPHLEEGLMEYGLFTDQLETFIPMASDITEWRGNGSQDASVTGWIQPTDKSFPPIPAIMHGLAPSTFVNHSGRIWTCVPLGVRMLGWGIPQVVCRLKSTLDIDNKVTLIGEVDLPPALTESYKYKHRAHIVPKKEAPDYSKADDDDEDDNIPYPGPGTKSLTRSEWFAETACGCVSCGRDLSITEDAWSLEWTPTDLGVKPLCYDCVAEEVEDKDAPFDDPLPAHLKEKF